MTVYVGERARIIIKATFEREPKVIVPIHPADVSAATISLWRSANEQPVVAEQPLEWDPRYNYWKYEWDTTGLFPGAYLVKTTFEGAQILRSWEFATVKLVADKTPTGTP